MIARGVGLLSLVGLAALPLATRSPERPMLERERGVATGDQAIELDIDGDERDQLLSRWNSFTPREQGELRERFERFKEIDDEERERLKRRGKRLDLMARHLYRELSEEDRERIDGMPSAKRRELLREMAADQARNAGRRIHDKLPPHLRKRLEQASPADRARFMEKYLSLIHISEPTRHICLSRMPSSA